MNLYLNGEYLPLEQGRVPVEDRGFQFGDGVYEVIRVYRGKPFRLAKHLARLEQSVKGIEMALPEPLQKIEEVCRMVIRGLEEAQIYLQVTRGTSPRMHAFPQDVRPTFVAYARSVQASPEDRVYKLKSVTDDRWGRCHLKTICLLPNILGRQRAAEAGCDEGLFVRENGIVTEGTASNAFFVRGGALFTHPSDNRILNGVTREAVLEIARLQGVRVRYQGVTLAEAMASEEVFVTGTLSEITPVVSIDAKPVGTGKPGPVTRKLRAAYRELTEKECG
jgi:D-alanine transaminase